MLPSAVVFSALPGFNQPFMTHQQHHLPKPLYSLYNQLHKTPSHAALKELWHEHRKGHVTASYSHDVYHHMVNGRCYPTFLVKRIMQYTDVLDVGALRWGRENEDKAHQKYISNINAKHHAKLVVTTSSSVISPKFTFLGASPDGVVNCECHGCGLLEIKCSCKYRNQQPTAEIALSDSSYFLKRGENGNIYLSRSHKYYHQVQGKIVLYNSMHCDFATKTPKRIFIECFDRDDPFIADVLPQLTSFFAKYLLLELLTHALEPVSEAIDNENEKIYCISCRPESGRMIACENAHCPTDSTLTVLD